MSEKIKLSDSIQDIMFKMSEGNPGSLTVCLQILKDGSQIDPENIMGGLGAILSLDTLGLYGAKIWMLYKDVCKQDLTKVIALLRGWQLGFVTKSQVHHAVESCGEGIDLDGICSKVTSRLTQFKLTQTP